MAIPEAARAIDLFRSKAGEIGDQIEDFGRVSDALPIAMELQPGNFIRV
jgi:hypothetical protein